MVNENIKLIAENKKPVETVYEIKNEVPSFEEFMETYEYDANLNYDDLSYSDISDKGKGYGPCGKSCETVIKDSSGNIHTRIGLVGFFLEVDCINWAGGGGCTNYLSSTSGALEYARELERGKYSNVSSEVELKCAILIRDAIRYYERGNKVFGHIKVQGKF